MGRFGWTVAVALVALVACPVAEAKEFRSLVVVGSRGDSVELRAREGLVDSFFDGASRFNPGGIPQPRPAHGGYVRLYPLGAGGLVGVPGRFYAETEAACFDWLQWRRPRDCRRPNDALLRLLAPARRLARYHGPPTTVAALRQPRLQAPLRAYLRAAVELAFDRSRLARTVARPRRCVPFSARWNGPAARSRPRLFCLSPAGAYTAGRLYPLGKSVWSMVSLNLRPQRRNAGTGPRGLPAAVALETPDATHTLLPSGLILVSPARREHCRGTTSMLVAGRGACLVQRGGRIAVLRNGREVWRSRGRYRLTGVFAKLGPRAIAFSYDSYSPRKHTQTLLVAPLGGGERVLARDERPLGWARGGGLLTWRSRGGAAAVYLRSPDGARPRLLAAGLAEIRWDAEERALLALRHDGVLSRYDGGRRERLADLRALGFHRRPTIELLDGGLVGVLGRSRVTVLRRDGSLFATAFVRPRAKRLLAGNSGLVANEAGTAVAFTVTDGNDGRRRFGHETVYVLRAADRQASPIYSHRLRFALCERWAALSWRGGWLLYAPTEGTTVAIDTTRPNRRVDLARVVERVGGRRGTDGKVDVAVRWAA